MPICRFSPIHLSAEFTWIVCIRSLRLSRDASVGDESEWAESLVDTELQEIIDDNKDRAK